MRKLALTSLAILALSCAPHHASGRDPQLKREILGLRIEASKAAVQKRLQEIGKFVRAERNRQEVWELTGNQSFSHLIVGFDSKDELHYVTAVAREDKDAKRVRYSEIGNTKEARQSGDPTIKNFNYEWVLPSREGLPDMVVIARGRHAQFLATYSLKKVGTDDSHEEND